LGEGYSLGKEELKEDETISMTNEISRMSFEAIRPSVDRIMSLDRKVIGYKNRTVSEPIYEDELIKNMTMKICSEVANTNLNSIYISINICLEGHNKYELCAYINSGCSVYFGKRSLFSEFMWKRPKNPLQVRIADNSIMNHNEATEGLSIELRGVQWIIPVLMGYWSTLSWYDYWT